MLQNIAMEKAKAIINIIFIVFGCLLTIMILTILIIHLVKKCKKTVKQKLSIRLIWKTFNNSSITDTEVSFELQSPVCSICLDESTNMTTQCGHHFHLNCIQQWFRQKLSCPFCQNQKLQKVQISCNNCKNSYFIFSTILLLEYYIVIESISKQCQKCTNQKQNLSMHQESILQNLSLLRIRSYLGGEKRKIIPTNVFK